MADVIAVVICLLIMFAILPILIGSMLIWIFFYFYLYLKFNGPMHSNKREFWKKPFQNVVRFLNVFSSICHGHETFGMENIPREGPALIIFYHSGFPLDFGCAMARIYTETQRKLIPVIEKKTFNSPGSRAFFQALEATAGPSESCVDVLKNGDLLAISPGGMRETLFSDENYQLLWNNRKGFARVAIEAKVPIIPLFTQNAREVTIAPKIGRSFFRQLYETRKYLYTPFFGWFPVKLRTFIGKPIEYDPKRSVDVLAEMSKQALEDLIHAHQQLPGSVLHALKERF